MRYVIITFSFLIFVSFSDGQILRSPDVYSDLYYDSGITKVEKREFNNGQWTSYKLDSIGRVIEKKSFRKKSPLYTIQYTYNDNHDITSTVSTYITDPLKSDTLKYYYEYSKGRIVYQIEKPFLGSDSTVYRMIENRGDSILAYKISTHRLSYDKRTNDQIDDTLTLLYHHNLLIRTEIVKDGGANKFITMYEYFEDGDLRRKVMKVVYTSGLKQMLMGAPGSDDQTFRYSYDKQSRIRDHYLIQNNKTYKLATYRYE